ncbi:LicD family protein [Fusobacterium gastrosuis]|uniref:LicD family protein n=1 Tax=Fusobacterium gastrosuis TaxID=1755100 RepID=UPI00297383B8|nr:LicD family protein [Fusobacteriaceae bacterium]MDY5712907.1 LicD family protein [Fusobacterium gastrosuis]
MTDLREFQVRLLKMLLEIDNILKKNNIKYFLVGGSVLGAVRHKGFIPWDDDIDIGLYREDFEKLEDILTEQLPESLLYYKIGESKYKNSPVGHIYDITKEEEGFEKYPVIDFFPIDNVPDSKILRKVQKFFSLLYHFTINRKIPENRGGKIKKLMQIVLVLSPSILLDFFQEVSKKIITFWNKKETKDICSLFGMKYYEKEIMPKIYIGTPKIHEFEGYNIPIPENWDKYLTHLYGDYMQLPPENERIPHHKNFKKN